LDEFGYEVLDVECVGHVRLLCLRVNVVVVIECYGVGVRFIRNIGSGIWEVFGSSCSSFLRKLTGGGLMGCGIGLHV